MIEGAVVQYVDQFRPGKASSAGRSIDVTCEIYEGAFANGQRHGRGITILPNGCRYPSFCVAGRMRGDCVSCAPRISDTAMRFDPQSASDPNKRSNCPPQLTDSKVMNRYHNKAFTLKKRARDCYLLDEIGEYSSNPDADSRVKRQPAKCRTGILPQPSGATKVTI